MDSEPRRQVSAGTPKASVSLGPMRPPMGLPSCGAGPGLEGLGGQPGQGRGPRGTCEHNPPMGVSAWQDRVGVASGCGGPALTPLGAAAPLPWRVRGGTLWPHWEEEAPPATWPPLANLGFCPKPPPVACGLAGEQGQTARASKDRRPECE